MTNLDPVALLFTIVLLGLAPFMALMATSYTKLVIVFGLLRSALGVQQVPPNMVLNALAIILSVYIMAPVGMAALDAVGPDQQLSEQFSTGNVAALVDAANEPLQQFMEKHTTARERQFFLKSAKSLWPADKAERLQETDLLVMIPAFTVSEISKAFQMGFVLYMIFVVVDLIIGTILLMMGMSMISPTTVAIPFKLLLFVALDGWSRLIHGLVMSYR